MTVFLLSIILLLCVGLLVLGKANLDYERQNAELQERYDLLLADMKKVRDLLTQD